MNRVSDICADIRTICLLKAWALDVQIKSDDQYWHYLEIPRENVKQIPKDAQVYHPVLLSNSIYQTSRDH